MAPSAERDTQYRELFPSFRPIPIPIGEMSGEELKRGGITVIEDIYDVAKAELTGLATQYEKNPGTEAELIEMVSVAQMSALEGDVSLKEVTNLFEAVGIFKDVATFGRRVVACGGDPELIEKGAHWLLDEEQQIAIKYVGPQAHRALQDRSIIGLTPLAAVDKLRGLQINCMGISAASPAIDLLVASGAEHIKMYDGGSVDPTNLPRFIGGMSSILNVGGSKSRLLAEMLIVRNPYGEYIASAGKVVPPGGQLERLDIDYDQFLDDADLVLEVVDTVRHKAGIDEYARVNYPHVIMGFLADLGHNPTAGLRYAGDGNHFNQPSLSQDTIRRMSNKDSGINPLSMVVAMTKKELTDDHQVQFLAIMAGLMGYWAQAPDASRESAAVLDKLVLAYLSGQDVLGSNYTGRDVPTDFMTHNLNPEQKALLHRITDKVFAF